MTEKFKKILIIALTFIMIFPLCSCRAVDEGIYKLDEVVNGIKDEASQQEGKSPNYDGIGEISIHYIDVGQGDCILIKQGKEAMLIDSGKYSDRDTICSYLKKEKIKKIKYFIPTHNHKDHIGSASVIMDTFKVENIILPKKANGIAAYDYMMKSIKNNKVNEIPREVGNIYTVGLTTFQIVAPSYEADTLNNDSTVIRLVFGKNSFLFAGDVEYSGEVELRDSSYNITCDVLKVSHHGAGDSTQYGFLRKAEPKIAIISVGMGNIYDHPHEGCLSRLKSADAQIYRTDKDGTVVVKSDGKALRVVVGK